MHYLLVVLLLCCINISYGITLITYIGCVPIVSQCYTDYCNALWRFINDVMMMNTMTSYEKTTVSGCCFGIIVVLSKYDDGVIYYDDVSYIKIHIINKIL